MGEIVKIAKLYGLREVVVKRLHVLSGLLKIKQESDVVEEYNILIHRLEKIDNEIFHYEHRCAN